MKKLLLLATIMAMFSSLQAQPWQSFQAHNNDANVAGDYLGDTNDDFTTWSGTTGTTEDAFIIDSVMTTSGSNCFMLNSSSQDIVWDLGLQEQHTFEVQFKFMVGVGKGGYWNFQKSNVPGVEWGGEAYFASDSTGYFAHASLGDDIPLTHTNGEWMTCHAIISMQLDMAFIWIGDNDMIIIPEWNNSSGSGDPGLNSLGAVNFYGAAPAGDDPEYYVDDCTFTRIAAASDIYSTIEPGMPGVGVAESMGGAWGTWSGTLGAEDAMVSNMASAGGLNSVYLSDASTDLVYHLNSETSGRIELSFDLMTEVGAGAYYNLMHVFDNVANDYEWALEVTLNGDGTATHMAGGETIDFDYTEGEWIRIEYVIDFDNDMAAFYCENKHIQEWQWSLQAGGDPSVSDLAVMDFYPAGAPSPSYYIDNISVQGLAPVPEGCADVEDFTAFYDGEGFAQGNPAWGTWSGLVEGEDAHITDTLYYSEPNSLELLGGMGTDVVRLLGHDTTGSYHGDFQIYVPTGGNGYFNLLHLFGSTNEWAMECYFNEGGTGSLNAGATDAAQFMYTHDEWHLVEVYIDIDNDYASLSLNGEEIYNWPWSNTATGEGGSSSLGAMNFYPPNGTSHYYIDDINFCFAEAGLSVEESVASTFSMYPNPANDMLIIENDFESDLNISIYNVSGQEVYSVDNVYNNGRINLPTSNLTDGVYLLQLGNENERITKRLVIQH